MLIYQNHNVVLSVLLHLLYELWQTSKIHFIIGKVQATFHVVNIIMLDILNIFQVKNYIITSSSSGVLRQGRHGSVGASLEEGHKNDQRGWSTSAMRTG